MGQDKWDEDPNRSDLGQWVAFVPGNLGTDMACLLLQSRKGKQLGNPTRKKPLFPDRLIIMEEL